MEFIEHWHFWLIIGFVVLIIELMSGTYFLLALAGGAVLTSVFTALFTPSITAQLSIFAVSSVAAYLMLLSFRKKNNIQNTDGTTHMLGQQVQVVDAINNRGRVRYKGVLWQAISEDLIPTKDFAKIVSVNGSTLTVKSLENRDSEEKT